MKTRILLFLALLLSVSVTHAQLTIEITKGVEGAIPVAIVPFATQGQPPEDIAAIVMADLKRSARFDVPSPATFPDRPSDFSELNPATWRALKMDYVVVGRVNPGVDGGYEIRFQLAEMLQGRQLMAYSFQVKTTDLRRLAHHISDLIYEQLIGKRGAFDSRIAYITAERAPNGGVYTLVVADADGYGPQVVLRSTEPLMSPSWSPDGNKLAYVSFEGRKPQIIVQDIYSGARQTIAAYPGINGAPSWSPDGQRLAFTLSKDGDPEIYLYGLSDARLVRLTQNSAIDTEPVWSPDGSYLIFTSDRGGSPQLYRLNLAGGRPERLTFEGDYNADASLSPDGQTLSMVHRTGGRFHIAIMEMGNRRLRILTQGSLDESPSFASNGEMIIYATSQGGREILAAVSVDGRVQQNLVAQGSNVREPAWSPPLSHQP